MMDDGAVVCGEVLLLLRTAGIYGSLVHFCRGQKSKSTKSKSASCPGPNWDLDKIAFADLVDLDFCTFSGFVGDLNKSKSPKVQIDVFHDAPSKFSFSPIKWLPPNPVI